MTWLRNQLFPIIFACLIFILLAIVLYFEIRILNVFPGEHILLEINWADVLVGMTIYLKTSVDFALLIGLLMKQYPGVKNRFAIETGTAVGNALGTMLVLVLWYFFKEIQWLLAIMIIFASLVLLKLAQTSVEHADEDLKEETLLKKTAQVSQNGLSRLNGIFAPVLNRIVPDLSFKSDAKLNLLGLLGASFTIPFILGTDDFAGYVPLFNIVNVFGFGIGVFLGHAVLNIFLFLNPDKTVQVVKNPVISLIGGILFVGLAAWGFWEAGHILFEVFAH